MMKKHRLLSFLAVAVLLLVLPIFLQEILPRLFGQTGGNAYVRILDMALL
jgi:small neutral amino acid transporter SnatA (MarC family)